MKATILGIIRHVLTIAGGALGSTGIATNGDIELIIGGLLAVVGIVWSVVEKKKAK